MVRPGRAPISTGLGAKHPVEHIDRMTNGYARFPGVAGYLQRTVPTTTHCPHEPRFSLQTSNADRLEFSREPAFRV